MGVTSPIRATDSWFVAEDQALVFTIVNSTGGVQDITGWTIQMKMALTQGGAAVLTKSASLTTPSSGICTVAVQAADTSALTPATYFYTLSRTDSGSNQVLAYGAAVLQARPV